MTQLQATRPHDSQTDVAVCRALDAITTRLLNDATANLDVLIDEYPEHAEQLRHLLPAMQAMAEVGRLSAASAASAMGDVTATAHASANPADPAQNILGDFRLIREVGRGGMGVVYEAEQISLGRRVALKVLPFAAVLDERQLARFKNESRAAATLHHTNIVPVFSVGCERGVHYYAMQFIEGHTLADVIAQLRKESGDRSQEQGSGVGGQGSGNANVGCSASTSDPASRPDDATAAFLPSPQSPAPSPDSPRSPTPDP